MGPRRRKTESSETSDSTVLPPRPRTPPPPKPPMLHVGQIILCKGAQKFEVDRLLGKGGFGEVYKVHLPDEPEKVFAMKIEPLVADNKADNDEMKRRKQAKLRLKVEVAVFEAVENTVNTLVDKKHFLRMHGRGKTPTFKYYLMDLIGLSLAEVLRDVCNGKFSSGTKIGIARQTLKSIESLHELGFLHRDVKAVNFAVGLPPNEHIIYILDFGIARKFRDATGAIILPRVKVQFLGTLAYSSINGLEQKDQCRKDDLEVWTYMMLEFYSPKNLWWRCYRMEHPRDQERVMKQVAESKKEMWASPRMHLAAGRLKMPLFYCDIMEAIKRMTYGCGGDFKFLQDQLTYIAKDEKVDESKPLDWVGKKKNSPEKVKKEEPKKEEPKKEEPKKEEPKKEKDAKEKKNKERKKESRKEDDEVAATMEQDEDSEDDEYEEDFAAFLKWKKMNKGRKKKSRETARTQDNSGKEDKKKESKKKKKKKTRVSTSSSKTREDAKDEKDIPKIPDLVDPTQAKEKRPKKPSREKTKDSKDKTPEEKDRKRMEENRKEGQEKPAPEAKPVAAPKKADDAPAKKDPIDAVKKK